MWRILSCVFETQYVLCGQSCLLGLEVCDGKLDGKPPGLGRLRGRETEVENAQLPLSCSLPRSLSAHPTPFTWEKFISALDKMKVRVVSVN